MAVWHIGFYKTGSTALQKAFFPLLPVSYANDDPAGRFLLDEQLLAPAARPLTRAGAAIVAELEERARPVVFSREQLCGSIWDGSLPGGVVAERIAAIDPAAKVVFFVRNQRDMLASLYQQCVKEGGWRALPAVLRGEQPGCDLDLGRLDYADLAEDYARRLGRERVHVVPYERLARDAEVVLDGLARFVAGVPWTAGPLPHRNPSLTAASVAVLRATNRAFRRTRFNERPILPVRRAGAGRWFVQDRLDGWIRRLDLSAKPDLRGEVERAVDLSRYAAGNRRLAELAGEDLGALGYPTT